MRRDTKPAELAPGSGVTKPAELAPGSGDTKPAELAPGKGGFSRRGLLGGVGLGAAATGLAACSKDAKPAATGAEAAEIGFTGEHQAGIATASQDRLAFAAFDLTSTRRADLIALLQAWTAAAREMTKGQQVTGANSDQVPPSDTGEAVGLPPSRLTITIGFGPSLFDHRFGLADRRPEALADLPELPGEDLQKARCGGDIGIQACADDPQVAFHAIRNLNRLGFGTTTMRWSQLGFGRTSTTSRSQDTPRNLMGFKDGTRNIKSEDTDTMKRWVWVGDETDQPWMKGGSYLVARRIQMHIEAWDRDFLADQEAVFGRKKADGAPLTGNKEFDSPNFHAKDSGGTTVIPADAHIRLASREHHSGMQILRRGFSYTDGIDPVTGSLDAGLFFICFQQNPHKQFVPLQRLLGSQDALAEYINHTGSALFACPPGVDGSGEDYWGAGLFKA